MDELVSIITPAWNASRFIAETIRSIQAQTWTEWELLVTDDCSGDDTVRIVRELAAADKRICLSLLPVNSGAAAARNEALDRARGRYIAFLDADDFWVPEKLARQIDFMRRTGAAFTATDYAVVQEDGTPTGRIRRIPSRLTYRQYLSNTAIGCLTVMIDREQTGPFHMPPIRSSQDMGLWCELLRRGFPCLGLRETLASYRLVSTSNTARKWRAATDVWCVYRRWERLSLHEAAWHFCGYMFHAVVKRL